MALVLARELLEAGIHFGHNSGRWNPKMNRYIWGKRNRVHIIDVRETVRGIIDAHYFLKKTASRAGPSSSSARRGRPATSSSARPFAAGSTTSSSAGWGGR